MKLAHCIEAAAAHSAVWLLRRLGPVLASNLGGAVASRIGPKLPVSKIAHRNLSLAMPELDAAARERIVRGVWDNLGRTAAEFPHVAGLTETPAGPGWEVAGREHVQALASRGGPALVFTGHIGNWEVLPRVAASQGLAFATLYRPADNPAIDALILNLRRASQGGDRSLLFPKGAQGARQSLAYLRQGGFVALLQDQKMNDGIEARFFGRPAMTASALGALAVRLKCPVLPTYAQRIGPARFRVTYESPLTLPASGDRVADVAALTQTVNDRLETWVRAAPESWLWLHRRWPKDDYADLR